MKKIMFSDRYGLTNSVLEGRKTIWRSVFDYETYRKLWEDMCRLGTPCFDTFDDFLIKRKAQYKVGEVVAVAQRGIDIYHALQKRYGQTSDAALGFKEMYEGMPMWNDKMFVPADLCPSQIRITDIKIERLQNISDEDCLREGIGYNSEVGFENGCYYFNDYEGFKTPKSAFASLINRICGKSTWEFNPWEFAYSFELVK